MLNKKLIIKIWEIINKVSPLTILINEKSKDNLNKIINNYKYYNKFI